MTYFATFPPPNAAITVPSRIPRSSPKKQNDKRTAKATKKQSAPLLSVLNVPDDVFPYALMYLRIYLLGMPVILLYNFEAAIFRSVGDTKVPLAALAISGVLNVLLNLFFVIVLHMTVNGVAIATVTANAVSAFLLYRRLTRTDQCVRVEG